ncbi:MAG: hypothetical protein HY001_01510 [Candidatus Portnoybacteria bacterium]|nr:hypothetical protein [Candidatus Portnoybacteria bacterium]
MNPKQFLQLGGIILVVVGLLGFVGLLGPGVESSIFGSAWWFDNAENWAHLVLGVVALIAAYALPETTHKTITVVVGVVAVLVGLYSVAGEAQLLGANLENPLDTILHLVVGAWALWASYKA